MQFTIQDNNYSIQRSINNKISKPSGSVNEFDILQVINGNAVYKTPNNGVVKIINIIDPSGIQLANNGIINIDISGNATPEFDPNTDFPKNISNQYPGQNPGDDYSTYLPFIYKDGKWFENPVDKQVHLWSITIDYVRDNTRANREIVIRMRNDDTGFEISDVRILPNGGAFRANTLTYLFTTIAESSSIANGYTIELQTYGAPGKLNQVHIMRTSLEKL